MKNEQLNTNQKPDVLRRTGVGFGLIISASFVATTLLPGCGPSCDWEALEASWGASEGQDGDAVLGVLQQTCSSPPPEFIGQESEEGTSLVADQLSCLSSASALTMTGVIGKSQRKELWDACAVSDMGLGSEANFLWAEGNPAVAVALSRWLNSKGVSSETAGAMGTAMLGNSLLPLAEGFSPATLPASAKNAVSPASRTVKEGDGTRIAVTGAETIDSVLSAAGESETMVLMGISADEEHVVEWSLGRGKVRLSVTEGATSVWLSKTGVTVYNGEKWSSGGNKECVTHSICATESGAIDLSAIGALVEGTGPIRVGATTQATVKEILPVLQAVSGVSGDRAIHLAPSLDYRQRDDDLTDLALWMGGMALLDDKKAPGGKTWIHHADRLSAGWAKFEKKTLQPSREWGEKNLTDLPKSTLFYPFSGPDIANGVNFFPDRPHYILAGLESIGELMDKPGEGNISQGLGSLRKALNTILGVNFFRTREMSGEYGGNRLGNNAYNGIGSALYVFLARTGNDLISARHVTLSEDGKVVDREGNRGGPTAVEVVFRKHSDLVPSPHRTQSMIYFSGNIADGALTGSRGLVKYIESQGEMVTFLKAASYLMYNRNFDDIRSIIMNRSTHVITESSGIPYHFFASDTENWKVDLYGEYTEPIPMFANRCQPDLKAAIKKNRTGDLTFRYGYNPFRSHLILAKRKTPIIPAVLDKSGGHGTTTVFHGDGKACVGGRLAISAK
jgi:hypothetical protein